MTPRDGGGTNVGPARREIAPDDESIHAMLVARTDRMGPSGLDVASIVAAAGPRARNAGPWGRLVPRLSLAASALAAVIVAGVLVVGPIVSRPVGSAAPNGSRQLPSGTVGPSPIPAIASLPPVQALMPAALGDLVRTRSTQLAGTIVAVRGRLENDPSAPCPVRGGICANTRVTDSGGGFHVRPIGDIGPGPWDGSGPIAGTFALKLTGETEGGRPVVDFIGTLITPTDSRLTDTRIAWSVDEIQSDAAHVEGAYAAVRGWLVRTPLHPCASIPHPPGYVDNGLTFGCPDDDYLTAAAYQPMQPDGSSIGAPNAIELPAGSYQAWAPSPAGFGRDSVGAEPRQATYLLQLVLDAPCGPTADCAATPSDLRWIVAGRLDPVIDGGAVSPTPRPSSGDAGLLPWTVSEIAAAQAADPFALADGRLLAVRGWLVATPPLRCLYQPVPSGAPSWGCDEIDWLTDDSLQPWTSDGSGASVRPPSVGLRVQNGAYVAFAPRQAIVPGGGFVPELATYLIRGSIHDGCEMLPAPTDSAPCAGPAVVLWEVVGSEPDVLHLSPPIRVPSLKPGETAPPGTDGSRDTPCDPPPGPCG